MNGRATERVYFVGNKQRIRILLVAKKEHFMKTFYQKLEVFTEGKVHNQIQLSHL